MDALAKNVQFLFETVLCAALLSALVGYTATAHAQAAGQPAAGQQVVGQQVAGQQARPTVQHRFAKKTDTVYAHATGAASFRNDFYHTVAAGLDVGHYFNESLGLELRLLMMANWEADAARKIREDTGFVPDARPHDMLLTAGARYSIGYGKLLVSQSVVHFDPQVTFGAGITLAKGRVLPTSTVGLALLTHYAYGIQAKLDLQMAFQLENRNRGWVPSFGFLPVLGVGWNFQGLGGAP